MCVIVEVAAAPPIDSRMWVEIDWIMLAGVFFWGAFAEFWRFPLKRFLERGERC